MAKIDMRALEVYLKQSDELATLRLKAGKFTTEKIHFSPFCHKLMNKDSRASEDFWPFDQWPSVSLADFWITSKEHCLACLDLAACDSPANMQVSVLLNTLVELNEVKPRVTALLNTPTQNLEAAFIKLDAIEKANLLAGNSAFTHFLKSPILDEVERVRKELWRNISPGADLWEFILPLARDATDFHASFPPLEGLDLIVDRYESIQEEEANKLAKSSSWCLVSFGTFLKDPLKVPGANARFRAILKANALGNDLYFLPLAAVAYYLKHCHFLRDGVIKAPTRGVRVDPPQFVEGADLQVAKVAAVLFNPGSTKDPEDEGVYSSLKAAYQAALVLD